MKIKTKLSLGSSWGFAVLIILSGLAWYQISELNRLHSVLEQNINKMLVSQEVQQNMKNEALDLRDLLLESTSLGVKQSIIVAQSDNQNVRAGLDKLNSTLLSNQERQMLASLNATFSQYSTLSTKTISLVEQGNKQAATNVLLKEGPSLQKQCFQYVSSFNTFEENSTLSQIQSLTRTFIYQLVTLIGIVSLCLLLGTAVVFWITSKITRRLSRVSQVMNRFSKNEADQNTRIEIASNDEIDMVSQAFNDMAQSLQEQSERERNINEVTQNQAWIKSNIAELTTQLSGVQDIKVFAQILISRVASLIEAQHGAFYLKTGEGNEALLILLSSYAYKQRKNISNSFRLGEGLVGQAALENSPIIITNVPEDYIKINSGLGEAAPRNIIVLPISFEGKVKAAIELATFGPLTDVYQSFLDELVASVGIVLDNIMGRMRLAEMLGESQTLTEELQAQSEELQTQQEELRVINEELESQTQALLQSENKLQTQQAELERTNTELTEKASLLEKQNNLFAEQNRKVEFAKAELEEKALQLELSSKYKSEFLANMSHELRTPLNSMLILSKLLTENTDGNLTEKQVQFASTMYSSGCDLLKLINSVLDLSKIESGKTELQFSYVRIPELKNFVERQFCPIAREKGLEFGIEIDPNVPSTISSDEQRLQQVLQNLLSNAFKFTEQGSVSLRIGFESMDRSSNKPSALHEPQFEFIVRDTGIGIPTDKQQLIFEAFQQVDGTTSRKYGGTGLGLSLSREIATLLGGVISVESAEGMGSTFTLKVPNYNPALLSAGEVAAANESSDGSLLKLDTVLSRRVEEPRGELIVEKHKPHISTKRVLIIDDDHAQRTSLVELIGSRDVVITAVSSGTEAMEQIKMNNYDCMILDLGLFDISGYELLERVKAEGLELTTFIYTGRDLSEKKELELKKYARTIIIKDMQSPQRLLQEFELFIRESASSSLDETTESDELPAADNSLAGKRILLVDDDVRNVFALTNVLELHGMEISFAENGRECIDILQQSPVVDLVLMDIMMPEMDGYEAIRTIRAMDDLFTLPIIALTAKAMKEDRQKCIDAGASDYITKPIDTKQLLSLMRVWIHDDKK